MGSALLLIHSPFTGPLIWAPVAAVLRETGRSVHVPRVQEALMVNGNFVRRMAARLRSAQPERKPPAPFFVVGHSAAGFFLPALMDAAGLLPSGYIFVDARLPAADSSLLDDSPPRFAERLRQLIDGDHLPPWHTWFDPKVIQWAIPAQQQRQDFIAEIRPVPTSLLFEKVDSGTDWRSAPAGYIRLSESYRNEAAEARGLGWVVREREGRHLDPLTDPDRVANLILKITAQLERSDSQADHPA